MATTSLAGPPSAPPPRLLLTGAGVYVSSADGDQLSLPIEGAAEDARKGASHRWKTVAAVGILIGCVAAFGYVGSRAIHLNQQVNALTRVNATLAEQKAGLERTTLEQSRTIGGMTQNIAALKDELAHPTLTTWNDCGGPCLMRPTSFRAAGVPDTFRFLVSFESTTPVAVYFLTLPQFVQFLGCESWDCIYTRGQGESWYSSRTSLVDGYFDLAEGCGSYVVVFKSTGYGTMTPNVRVQYLPADQPTGVCASGR